MRKQLAVALMISAAFAAQAADPRDALIELNARDYAVSERNCAPALRGGLRCELKIEAHRGDWYVVAMSEPEGSGERISWRAYFATDGAVASFYGSYASGVVFHTEGGMMQDSIATALTHEFALTRAMSW